MTLRSVRLPALLCSLPWPVHATTMQHYKKAGYCRTQTARLDELQACDGPLLLSTTTTTLLLRLCIFHVNIDPF